MRMRKINKGEPLEAFAAYIRKHHPTQWKVLPSDISRQCRMHILDREQDGLSGYTEKLLDKENDLLHIDHFKKRKLFNTSDDVFNWANLIVDEKNPLYGADAKDNGPNGVKTREEYARIVNPAEEDPHHYFQYMADGQIVPSDGLGDAEREKAQHTIDVFNLNYSALRNARKDKIRNVKSLKVAQMSSAEVLEALRYYGFPSVVEYFCRPQVFEAL